MIMLNILWHIFMIVIGFVLIEFKRANYFAQLFWGLIGAWILLDHASQLVSIFI